MPPQSVAARGATRALADWVASRPAVPDSTRASAGRCVLDWLGAGVAGTALPAAAIAHRVAMHLGGPPESSLLGGSRAAATGAALANGVASHAVEMDDLHRASIMHLGVVTIPAALALAEREHASGRRFLEAVVCGYEVGSRVGDALGQAHYRFWHTTGTAGTFAAAAAGASVLGLSADQTRHALGSAGTLCAGLWEFLADGAMSKTLHAGRAAETGVLCALLAREGFTGASTILEGDRGVLNAMAGGGRPERLTAGLGDGYRIDGNSFKLHAACGHTHAAVDGALALRRRGVRAPEIAEVRVATFRTALDVCAIADPRNPYQAKFSLPFCVALALVRGRVGLDDFTEASLADPEVRAAAGRVIIEEDPACTRVFPDHGQATVTVTTTGGRRDEIRIADPLGSPQNPVSDADLEEKFGALTRGRLSPGRRDAVLRAVRGLADAEDVAALPWSVDADDRG